VREPTPQKKPTVVEGLNALAALAKAVFILLILGIVGWAVLASCFSHSSSTSSHPSSWTPSTAIIAPTVNPDYASINADHAPAGSVLSSNMYRHTFHCSSVRGASHFSS
jgi:hypothetical protein